MHVHALVRDLLCVDNSSGRADTEVMVQAKLCRVVIVGGDNRFQTLEVAGARIWSFGSSGQSGSGSLRQAKAKIKGRAVDLVVVAIKWLGHSDHAAIEAACRKAKVRLVKAMGGFESIEACILKFLGER